MITVLRMRKVRFSGRLQGLQGGMCKGALTWAFGPVFSPKHCSLHVLNVCCNDQAL